MGFTHITPSIHLGSPQLSHSNCGALQSQSQSAFLDRAASDLPGAHAGLAEVLGFRRDSADVTVRRQKRLSQLSLDSGTFSVRKLLKLALPQPRPQRAPRPGNFRKGSQKPRLAIGSLPRWEWPGAGV